MASPPPWRLLTWESTGPFILFFSWLFFFFLTIQSVPSLQFNGRKLAFYIIVRARHLSKKHRIDTGARFVFHAFQVVEAVWTLADLICIHLNCLPLPAAVNHSLRGRGRERERKGKVSHRMDGSRPSAQCTGTNFRRKPTQGKEFSFSVRYISLWHLKSH